MNPRAGLEEKVALVKALARDRGRLAPPDPIADNDVASIRRSEFEAIVPARFRDARLDQVEQSVRDELAAWARDPRRGNLIISGPVGPGKTHAATAVLREIHAMGTTVQWVSVSRLLALLRPDGGRRVEDFVRSGVLLLDDVGAEELTVWAGSQLEFLVDGRYCKCRPIVLTTNLPMAQLKGVVGERTYDRLLHDLTALSLGGASRRSPAPHRNGLRSVPPAV